MKNSLVKKCINYTILFYCTLSRSFLFMKLVFHNIMFTKNTRTLESLNLKFQKEAFKVEIGSVIGHAIQYMFNFRVTGQEKNEGEQSNKSSADCPINLVINTKLGLVPYSR